MTDTQHNAEQLRASLVKDVPWLAENYRLDAIIPELKKNAWLKAHMNDAPGIDLDTRLAGREVRLTERQLETLEIFKDEFRKLHGKEWSVESRDGLRKTLAALEHAFEDLSHGYSPVNPATGKYSLQHGALLAYRGEGAGACQLSEKVLLGKIAPRECPYTMLAAESGIAPDERFKPRAVDMARYKTAASLEMAGARTTIGATVKAVESRAGMLKRLGGNPLVMAAAGAVGVGTAAAGYLSIKGCDDDDCLRLG